MTLDNTEDDHRWNSRSGEKDLDIQALPFATYHDNLNLLPISHQVAESLDDSGTNSAPSNSTGPPCSCVEHLLDMMQKLDDDFFGLRRLALDQVLQVMKLLMFHCCQPLDCDQCSQLPIINTNLLIVCDRVTELFSCLSKRLSRSLAGNVVPRICPRKVRVTTAITNLR